MDFVVAIEKLGFPIFICVLMFFNSRKCEQDKNNLFELYIKQLGNTELNIKRDILSIEERIAKIEKSIERIARNE